MFAIVAVNTSVHSGGSAYRTTQAGGESLFPGPVFHYHIPPPLGEQVTPGALVELPFGAPQVQGIVVALADVAPVPETRPVTRALYDDPVLDARQIELGMWLSKRYFAPLIDCLRLMLPPGMLRQPRPVVRLHPETPVPANLSAAQQQVIELVRQHGTLSRTQIAQRIGRERAERAIRGLTRRGVLITSSDLPAPRIRPKRVNFVRLLASPPQVDGVRPLLGRPSKQAAVLQALIDSADPLSTTENILAQADATTSTLATLARKEWIAVEPERTLILLLSAATDADLYRAPQQRAVLDHLRAQGIPTEERALRRAANASAATVTALVERELVRRVTEPATVLLRLDEQQTQQQIVALRGATRQNKVLDYLSSQPSGEWIWVSWIYAATDAKLDDLHALESHGVIELAEHEVWRDPLADQSFVLERPPRLTPDQQRVWTEVQPCVEQDPAAQDGASTTFLLHGVTGSGKTEIYMRAAQAVLQRGRQAIILVPEISLTPQTIQRFAARIPKGLGAIHSGLSDGERYDTWRRIRAGQIQLVIGPRSALFAPMPDIGLIVLDEEHDASYKQSDTVPTYHGRDVASQVARIHGGTVLLGSATPDLTTFYRAHETDAIHMLKLPQRLLSHRRHVEQQQAQLSLPEISYAPLGPDYEDVYTTDLPPVRVVDMRHELRVGNRSMFSRVLQEGMENALANKEQIILFLNRRGASTFVLCRDCGNVIRCPHCEIPLTFHSAGERLTCHHCNHQQPVPQVCPICQSRRIKHFGVGTQQVETTIQRFLPRARILRWDRDTTREKGSHQALLSRFVHHEADVLIGTQMIAKGLDLPLVTLVGVISADTALNLPDFRAAERTFQLLTQVAGRAGRGPRGGRVVVQTYTPEHYAIQAAAKHDYDAFYAHERPFRHQLGYPPFARLARLLYSDADAARCRQQARALGAAIDEQMQNQRLRHIHVIGPAPCFLSRLRGSWRWQIILRATQPTQQQRGDLDTLFELLRLPPGWRLDIDPLNML